MNIAEPFIRRPVATALLAVAVLLAGMAAFAQLPVAPLPRIDFPTVMVNAGLPGASPETMAASVATPLERRLGRIAGVTEMTSSSTLGSTSITLQFDLARDPDAAGRDVQAAINAALGELPGNLPMRPNYRKVNPSDAPILILALTSPTLPTSVIFDQANTVLAQQISRVPGVGQVFVGGGQQPAVRVQADPVALAGVGLTLEDLRATLASATANTPKGGVAGPRSSSALTANDQLFDADAFRAQVVAFRNGGTVRLGDVARVFDDVENNRVAAWADRDRAVLVIIRKQPGANVIETIRRVRELLPSLARSISPAIHVEVIVDRAETIRASVREVELTLALAVILVVLVVYLFLRNAWATLIPSVAVPLSIIGTFGVMYLLDYSVDNLSLMALTISTGFVIDDAIVVTENVTRYLEAGATTFVAALKGAKQIGFTIVSITASLLAVFIPILMMGGVVGRLFREFAVTLSIAIAISAVVSLTVTPALCSRLLRRDRQASRRGLYRMLERGFDSMLHAYEWMLDRVLAHRILTLTVAAGLVVASVYLAMIVPKGLFPQQDTGLMIGFSEAPQNISFAAMRERQQEITRIVRSDPDVAHTVSFIGAGPGGSAGNTGTVFVALRPREERVVTADQIIARLRLQLVRVPGIALYLQASQDVRVGGRSARTQYQYTLEDADLEELRTWSARVFEALRGMPELRDVATDQQVGGLSLGVRVDRDTASRLGISLQNVDETLYDAFGQRQVATLFAPLNEYRVVLEATPETHRGPDGLNDLYLRSGDGGLVPLYSIARAVPSVVPIAVNHHGQFPAVTLSFNLAPGVSLGAGIAAIDRAERRIGVPASLRTEFTGTAQAFQASLASQPWLILAALIAVYIVLGVLYESLVHPITILSTLPPAGVGALLALLLFHVEFSVIALIGMVLLIGIVKKNAIMMVDFAIEAEREEGLSSLESIRRACILRFRPITMTTMAALLGALPLALGSGSGAELRRPLGLTIVGGLIASQMITLFTTPVIYLALDRFAKKKRVISQSPIPVPSGAT